MFKSPAPADGGNFSYEHKKIANREGSEARSQTPRGY
jgi:hypothetical protein